MSDSNVVYSYESLSSIDLSIFSTLVNVQIVPSIRNKETGEIYALLTINSNGVVCEFGDTKKNKSMSITRFITLYLKINSLNTIRLSEDYILKNTQVAYATSTDVETGVTILRKVELPIFFINIDIPNMNSIHDLLLKFKSSYKDYIKKTIISDRIHVTNMIYISPHDLFNFLRGEDYKVIDENNEIFEISIDDNGFPALKEITEIYSPKYDEGEIPVNIHPNEYANCCPEVHFYKESQNSLKKSFMKFFEKELEILM